MCMYFCASFLWYCMCPSKPKSKFCLNLAGLCCQHSWSCCWGSGGHAGEGSAHNHCSASNTHRFSCSCADQAWREPRARLRPLLVHPQRDASTAWPPHPVLLHTPGVKNNAGLLSLSCHSCLRGLPVTVHKRTHTGMAVPCRQGSGITVSFSAGQAAGLFSSVSISMGYQTQRHFWAVQMSASPGKSWYQLSISLHKTIFNLHWLVSCDGLKVLSYGTASLMSHITSVH